MLEFWDETGMTVVDQDGAETGGPVCANESHSHHHGLNDSLLVQWQKTQDTFKEYAKRGAEHLLFVRVSLYYKLTICQDRLGTNAREPLETRRFLRRWLHPGHARVSSRRRPGQVSGRQGRD